MVSRSGSAPVRGLQLTSFKSTSAANRKAPMQVLVKYWTYGSLRLKAVLAR